VKADILAQSGNTAEAEVYLRKSLDLSRRQCALGWELRGAISLGRIWRQSGKAGDVRALLVPLLARYQEGLQTRDLVAARNLLGAEN
jgi:predicted ATPase